MTYKDLLESAAREFNTTPDEIEKEMSAAVKSAGLNISPELFIALAAQETKKRIKDKQAVPKRGGKPLTTKTLDPSLPRSVKKE